MTQDDRQLDSILKADAAEWKRSSSPHSTCIDAETMAAWIDGGLSATDARAVEKHLSECARCIEIAGMIERSTVQAAASTVPAGAIVHGAGFKVALALAASLVLATAIGFKVWSLGEQGAKPRQSADGESAKAPLSTDVLRGKAPGGLAARETAQPSRAAGAKRDSANARTSTPQSSASATQAAAARPEPPVAPAQVAAVATPPAAAPAPPVVDSKKLTTGATFTKDILDNIPAARDPWQIINMKPGSVAGMDSTGMGNGRGSASGIQVDQAAAGRAGGRGGGAPRDITITTLAATWRVVSPVVVEWKRPGDPLPTTLVVEQTATPSPIIGGFSPSEKVCWLVARGAVWLTTGADVFRRVTAPDAENVVIASIVATDERHATIVAADARRFSTTDAGKTWVLEK